MTALILEWLAFSLSLVCSWVYGNRTIWGPILGVFTALAFMAFGFVSGIYAAAFANIIFLFVHIRNGLKFMSQDLSRKLQRAEIVIDLYTSAITGNGIGQLVDTYTGLNELRDMCYASEVAAGWRHNVDTGEPLPFNPSREFCLINSEISEMMEAHRKDLRDDKLPQHHGMDTELADVLIRLLNNAGHRGIDLEHNFRPALNDFFSEGIGAKPKTIHDAMMALHMTVAGAWMTTHIEPKREDEANAIRAAVGMCFYINDTFGRNLSEAFRDKLEYNQTRPDHRPENRKRADGKNY